MEKLTLDIKAMANGGKAVGRAGRGRTVFVPFVIPGEKIRATIQRRKNKIVYATVDEVLRPSPDRIEPTCRHFGRCGGCHWQHMRYETQLTAKRDVIIDQMERIGHLKNAPVAPTLASPQRWQYGREMILNSVVEGGLGYWSPGEKKVIPVSECPITRSELVDLLSDIDLELPGLRKITLRLGDDEALMAAVEVDNVEPPRLEADFPISVAIILPDKTAVNLVGDNYNVQTVNGRDFRVSPGCHFHTNPEAFGLVVNTVLSYADLSGSEQLLELYSGIGTLTSFLAGEVAELIAIEQNPDAVADTAVNVKADNVSLYEGMVEVVLPQLDIKPEVIVLHPPRGGVSKQALQLMANQTAKRLIYISSDVATFARDGRELAQAGYTLKEIQPVDTRPQTYHADMVGLWEL